MLSKLKKSNSKGFTIIEIMIVLAIAGLILLIVFLAIPALQRNARNTTIKNDAGAVAGGISEFESNNAGTSPGSITGTGTVTITCAGVGCLATPATARVNGSTVVSRSAAAPGSPIPAPATGTIVVHAGFRCDNTGSARGNAIVYAIETAGAASAQCVDS